MPVAGERTFFGTDGVRGLAGSELTVELAERLGRAAALWSGAREVLIGRDTRVSGPELEQAVARGVASAGANALIGGILPTPAVALACRDMGVVISASHNPPEYNGINFFSRGGIKLVDSDELAIEHLLDATPAPASGATTLVAGERQRYLDRIVARFGSDLTGLRIAVDCANGAFAGLAPDAFSRLGAELVAIGNRTDGRIINTGCGATDTTALQQTVIRERCTLGVAFDGDGDRLIAVDEQGGVVDGDQLLAVLALHLRVEMIAVTQMSNLGLHRLMKQHGVRVETTPVGDRYVLDALRRHRGVLGGEQSGHVICLDGHVTGDGLAAALLLCQAIAGRTLSEAAAVMPLYPQVKENVRLERRIALPAALLAQVAEINGRLAGAGRVLVRASGTEPLVRVLAEAATEQEASRLHLQARELLSASLAV